MQGRSPAAPRVRHGKVVDETPQPPLAVEQARESPDRRRKDARLDAYLVGVPAAMRAFGLDADAMLPRTDETAALPRQQLMPRVVHADQTQAALPGR